LTPLSDSSPPGRPGEVVIGLGRGSFFLFRTHPKVRGRSTGLQQAGAAVPSCRSIPAIAGPEPSGSRSFQPHPEGEAACGTRCSLLRPGPKSPWASPKLCPGRYTPRAHVVSEESTRLASFRKRRVRRSGLGSEEPRAVLPHLKLPAGAGLSAEADSASTMCSVAATSASEAPLAEASGTR
jgi:hypothetical protein